MQKKTLHRAIYLRCRARSRTSGVMSFGLCYPCRKRPPINDSLEEVQLVQHQVPTNSAEADEAEFTTTASKEPRSVFVALCHEDIRGTVIPKSDCVRLSLSCRTVRSNGETTDIESTLEMNHALAVEQTLPPEDNQQNGLGVYH